MQADPGVLGVVWPMMPLIAPLADLAALATRVPARRAFRIDPVRELSAD